MNACDRADEERMFGALPRYTTSCERSFSYCHFFKHLVTGDLLKKGYSRAYTSRAYTQGFKAEGEVEVVFQEMKLVGCEALLLMAFSSFQPCKLATDLYCSLGNVPLCHPHDVIGRTLQYNFCLFLLFSSIFTCNYILSPYVPKLDFLQTH